MSSIKDIKQRIANVNTTRQITKAMDLVSSTKLQSARRRLNGVRPLYSEMRNVIDDLRHEEEAENHVFVKQRAVKNTVYIVITSDKGLCGNYNISISKLALAHMETGKNEKIFAIGSRGIEFFHKHDKNVVERINNVTEAQVYSGTERLSQRIMKMYLSGEVDEVYVAYTHFKTTLSREPRVEKLLPLSNDVHEIKRESKMKYEQGVNMFLDKLIPLYLHTSLFWMASESLASEHAARMVSMESASKNAGEIIDDLNLMYNRKRQAAITQELSEIIGGANILK